MIWKKERVQIVQDLADKDLSASQIGKLLDVSRNAVIGLCHRMDIRLSGKTGAPATARKAPTRKAAVKKPKPKLAAKKIRVETVKSPPPSPPPSIPPKLSFPLPLFELAEHQCRWPFGEHPHTLFCGKDRIPNSSYCTQHDRRSKRGWYDHP